MALSCRATLAEFQSLQLSNIVEGSETSHEPHDRLRRSVIYEASFDSARDLENTFGSDWFVVYDRRVAVAVVPKISIKFVKVTVMDRRERVSGDGSRTDVQLGDIDVYYDIEFTCSASQTVVDSGPYALSALLELASNKPVRRPRKKVKRAQLLAASSVADEDSGNDDELEADAHDKADSWRQDDDDDVE